MIANALQRLKNDKHPIEYLKQIEDNVVWAGSRLLSPCVIKSYTMSAIVKWEDKLGGKFTNALGRQFGYSKNLQVLAIFKDEALVEEISKAVKSTPLTYGDSESPISVENEIKIGDVRFIDKAKGISTDYPIPFSKNIEIQDGTGRLFLVHERCMKREDSLPLKSYVFPIKDNNGIFEHSPFTVNLLDNNDFKVLEIDGLGNIVLEERKEEPEKKTKRKSKKKK